MVRTLTVLPGSGFAVTSQPVSYVHLGLRRDLRAPAAAWCPTRPQPEYALQKFTGPNVLKRNQSSSSGLLARFDVVELLTRACVNFLFAQQAAGDEEHLPAVQSSREGRLR